MQRVSLGRESSEGEILGACLMYEFVMVAL